MFWLRFSEKTLLFKSFLRIRLLKFIPSQTSPKQSRKLGIHLKGGVDFVCHINMPSSFGCLPSQIRYILTVSADNEILIYLRQSLVSFVHQFFQRYKVSAIARGGAQNPFYYFIHVSPPLFLSFPSPHHLSAQLCCSRAQDGFSPSFTWIMLLILCPEDRALCPFQRGELDSLLQYSWFQWWFCFCHSIKWLETLLVDSLVAVQSLIRKDRNQCLPKVC